MNSHHNNAILIGTNSHLVLLPSNQPTIIINKIVPVGVYCSLVESIIETNSR